MSNRWVVFICRVVIFAGVLSMIAGLAGCRQSNQPGDSPEDVRIELIIPQTVEPVVGDYPLGIRLTTSEGSPITDATIELRGDMTHAGMIPVFGEVFLEDTDGSYPATIEWTMAGDWIVTVTATLPDGRVASQDFAVVVGSE